MSGQRWVAWVQWLALGGMWTIAANALADVVIPRTDVLYVLGAAPGGGSTTQFGMIELSRGKYTQLVRNVNGTQLLHNLAWSPQLGGFYTSAGNLVRTLGVDGTLGATVHAFGTAERFTGLAHLSASDQLVAYSYELGGSSDYLRVGDMPTASWTTLTQDSGLVNSSYAGRLVAHQGGLYATLRDVSTAPTVGRFGTYDTTAGAAFQSIATHLSFQYMALASDGETLYGVYAQPGDSFDYGELYAIDPVSGARTQLRTITGTDVPAVFYGAAFALPAETRAVPEPSLFWALAFALSAKKVSGLFFSQHPAKRCQDSFSAAELHDNARIRKWDDQNEPMRPGACTMLSIEATPARRFSTKRKITTPSRTSSPRDWSVTPAKFWPTS